MVKGKNHKKYFRKKKLEKQKKEKEKIKLFNEITCGNTEEKNSFDFKIPDFIDDKPNKDKNQDNDANISNFNHTLKPSAETPSELNLNELDDIYSLDLNNSGNGIYNFHQIIDDLYTRPNPNLNNETGLNLNADIFDDDDNYKSPDDHPMLLFNCNKEKDKYEIPNYIKSNFPEIGMKDKDSLNNIDNDNNNSLDIYDNNIDIKSYININNNNNAIDNYNSSNGNNNDNNNDNSIKDTNELKYNISETVEEEIDMNSWFSKIWKKITGAFKKAWNWLKEKGILSKIKNILITVGKAAATALCANYFSAAICGTVIGAL